MNRLEQKYRYYAFISYNHRDEREAKWLQRQLEHYRLPSVARKEIGEDIKIRPVFRYAVNLSLGDLRTGCAKCSAGFVRRYSLGGGQRQRVGL